MPPRSFGRTASMQPASFPKFNDLPKELRLMIWGFATNIPRIVHLIHKHLRTDKDPDWWMQVRSDKPTDGEDPEDYGGFEITERDHWETTTKKEACERLLTPDDKYTGSMTRADAKWMLQYDGPPPYRPSNRVNPLYGWVSESSIPVVLLVCKESFSVASKAFSRTFASLGALPQTYFNYHLDTLYLDYESLVTNTNSTLKRLVPTELALVENLAVCWDDRLGLYQYSGLRGEKKFAKQMNKFAQSFPSLKQLTFVEDHFHLTGDERNYRNLKFVNSTAGWDGMVYTYRMNGYRIDESIVRPMHPTKLASAEWLAAAEELWYKKNNKGRPWRISIPQYKSLITEEDEKRILEEAFEFEKKYNKGCWYINPDDVKDIEEYPWDDIDDDMVEI